MFFMRIMMVLFSKCFYKKNINSKNQKSYIMSLLLIESKSTFNRNTCNILNDKSKDHI